MPVTYEKTDKAVESVVDRMIMAHHKDFCAGEGNKALKVDTIFAVAEHGESGETDANPIVVAGFNRPAKTVIRGLKDRSDGFGDIQIIIDRGWWEDASMGERDSEIDRQLTTVDLKKDSEGKCKFDANGRPCLARRRPDARYDLYHEVQARHGEDSSEWQEMKHFVDQHGQGYFGWNGDNDPRPSIGKTELMKAAESSIQGGAGGDKTKEKDPDAVRPAVTAAATANPKRKTKGSKSVAAETTKFNETHGAGTHTEAWQQAQRPPIGQLPAVN